MTNFGNLWLFIFLKSKENNTKRKQIIAVSSKPKSSTSTFIDVPIYASSGVTKNAQLANKDNVIDFVKQSHDFWFIA